MDSCLECMHLVLRCALDREMQIMWSSSVYIGNVNTLYLHCCGHYAIMSLTVPASGGIVSLLLCMLEAPPKCVLGVHFRNSIHDMCEFQVFSRNPPFLLLPPFICFFIYPFSFLSLLYASFLSSLPSWLLCHHLPPWSGGQAQWQPPSLREWPPHPHWLWLHTGPRLQAVPTSNETQQGNGTHNYICTCNCQTCNDWNNFLHWLMPYTQRPMWRLLAHVVSS